jgi:glycosyltransferase involved in cell wall biosynthesis
MRSRPDVFIGITSWNSALFLPICLRAIQENSAALNLRIMVLDNMSNDNSAGIAKALGAEVLVHKCTQPDALNKLLSSSDAPYTLLLHADVVLLDNRWFDLCRSKINEKTILVSPEDIGCGPYSRPFGIGMPESSFMFSSTAALRCTSISRWERWHGIPVPRRAVDFYGSHVTHRLPQRLSEHGHDWFPMLVHPSVTVSRRSTRRPSTPRSGPMNWGICATGWVTSTASTA